MRDYFDFFDLTSVGDLALQDNPAWLWTGDGTRVAWCNPAGAAFLRAPTWATARVRKLPAQSPAARELARFAATRPDGHQAVVSLRFQMGVRSRNLSCHCRRLTLESGEAAVLAVALQETKRGEPEELADRLAAFLGDEKGGFALVADDRILANPCGADETALRHAVTATQFTGRRDPVTLAGHPATLISWSDPLSTARAADAQGDLSSPIIRFVWRMDAQTRMTLVSDDIERVLDVRSADLIGLDWDQITHRYGVDESGAVARALAGRDMWSGLTLHWPIGSGHQIPIDLSALPTFDADREFTGFRGFGLCRPADAVAADHPANIPPRDGNTDAGDSTNVVRLHASSDQAITASGLSATEQAAFRQIAETLGARLSDGEIPGETHDAPTTTDDSEPDLVPSASQIPSGADTPRFDLRLIDLLPVGVLICRDNKILFANKTGLTLLGYEDCDQLRRNGGLGSVFADPFSVLEDADGGRFDDSRPRDSRIGLRHRDGEMVHVSARMYRVPWNGSSALMITIEPEPARGGNVVPQSDLDEVAAAHAARDAARDRAKELETILETATDGVVVMTGAGKILSANHSAEALFGRDRVEIVGSNIAEFLAPESRRIVHDYIDGLANYGVASVLNDGREVIGETGQGGLMPLFMTIGRIGPEAKPKFCAVLRDITQWKKAEADLTNAKRDAENANSQKSDFLARISHEIRTPLNAIIGFSEVMMEQRFGPIGNDRYREYLHDIYISGSHIMSLINDLLDLSKIEAGKMDLAFEAVGIVDVINECVALMQPQANRDRVIIRTSLAANLPRIVADERSIRQIVLNLLSNAIKFNVDGGQVIVSAALEASGEVALRVRDTGIGMSDEDVETALEPFRQLHTARTGASAGSGLGLPLTKALVEANRAAFSISSTLNQGTLVEILFPATRVLAE